MQRRLFLSSIGCVSVAPAVWAQSLPETTRIVLPFSGGNPMDASVRLLAESLRKVSSRNYIVDNKPGAGALIGSADVAKSKPDGSTLLYTTGGHTTNAAIRSKMPYDSIEDFTPITQLSISPGFVLLVGANSPYKTLAEFLAQARKQPNTLTYASAGNGNTTHIVGALFARSAKVELLHVPYKTSSTIDVTSGRVDCTFLGSSLAKPLIDSGQMRGLAISGSERAASLPQIPTLTELGINGVDIPAWGGILGPRGMSDDLVNTLHTSIKAAVADPAYVTGMEKFGDAKFVVTPPKVFAAYLKSEIDRYKKVLPPLNISMD